MSDLARIALIAIRGGATGSRFDALVIGSVDEGGTHWRYAIFDLEDLRALLAAGLQPLAEPSTLLAYRPKHYFTPASETGFLRSNEKEDLLGSDIDDRSNRFRRFLQGVDPKDPRNRARLEFAIPFRDVVKIVFYCKDADRQPSVSEARVGASPLALLDTCRDFDDTRDHEPAPPEPIAIAAKFVHLGSRLILVRDRQDPVQDPGRLDAFAVLAQTRLALNGHNLAHNSTVHKRDEAFDTQGVVRLYAFRPKILGSGAPRDLWYNAGARGAQFDRLRIGFSVAHGGHDSGDKRIFNEQRIEATDLTGFLPGDTSRGDERRARLAMTESGLDWRARADYIPLLRQLGLPENRLFDIGRELGFRAVETSGNHPVRLALRFEVQLGAVGQWLQGGALHPTIPPGFVFPSADPTYLLAQEQPRGAINWSLQPSARTTWLLTARAIGSRNDQLTNRVRQAANAAVTELHGALRQARDAGPLSFLPMLDAPAGNLPWHHVGWIVDLSSSDRTFAVGGEGLTVLFRTLEPRFIADMWRGQSASPLQAEARAELPRVVLLDRSHPALTVTIAAPLVANPRAATRASCTEAPSWQPALSELDPEDAPAGTVMSLHLTEIRSPQARKLRLQIGALRLRLAQEFPQGSGPAGPGSVDQTGTLRLLGLGIDAGSPTARAIGIDAAIKLPVALLEPGAQDDLPDDAGITADERAGDPLASARPDPNAPLLFPIDAPSVAGLAVFGLVADETVTRHENHTLSLAVRSFTTQVRSPRAKTQTGRVVVLDPQPMRIAAIAYRSPAAGQADESNEVAVWNAGGENGLSWRLVDDAESIHLLLPPQVLGEAMEKNRGTSTGPGDVNEGRAAAARFGSPTRLTLDPSLFDSRYVEPGWNLRRLLGWAGQRAPGSGLRDLRLELVYGMLTRLKPSANIQVAEIGATIGVPAALLPDQAGADRVRLRRYLRSFRRFREIEQRRLAVDKLWRDRPDGALTLDGDVGFRLRRSFKRTTIDEGGATLETEHGPRTPLRWPVPGGVPADLPHEVQSTFSDLADDGKSFPGGVAWAFESANILRSLYAAPDSVGGRVQHLHLSALGGWGGQRALFDERKQVVETETMMGRVHRYKLERVGRIGALWNRAKHVIIYERTVLPSPQFYNTGAIGREQDELLGRPVLRKVEEYVEILQPLRRFPEKGGAIAAAGCLTGAEFRSQRIRVDSRWGGDVRREGWQVPLWNKAFAEPPLDPANPDDPAFIYPKPQIRFLVAGEAGQEVALEIAEPEKLVFYTSVMEGEGDETDAWRPVREVDFVDLPLPVSLKRLPTSSDLVDATLPGEPRHVPGYERLTIGLVEAKEAAALTHGRQASGPVALLRNLTIGRASPREEASVSEAVKLAANMAQVAVGVRGSLDRAAGEAGVRIGKAVAELDRAVDPARWKADAKGMVDDLLHGAFVQDLESRLAGATAIVAQIGQLDLSGSCQALSGRIRTEADAQVARFERVGHAAIMDAANTIRAPLQTIGSRVEQFLQTIEQGNLQCRASRLKAVLRDGVNALDALIDDVEEASQESARRAKADLRGIVDIVGGGTGESIGAVEAALDEVTAAVLVLSDANRPFAEAVVAAQRGREWLDKAHTALERVDAARAPAAARRVLVLAAAALDRCDRALKAVVAEAEARRGDLAIAAEQAQRALDAFVEALKIRVEAAGTTANSDLDRVSAGIHAILDEASDAVRRACDALRAQLPHLRLAINGLDPTQPPESVRRAVQAAGDRNLKALGALDTAISEATVSMQGIVTRAKSVIQPHLDAMLARVEGTCQTFEGFVQGLSNSVDQVEAWMKESLDIAGYRDRIQGQLHEAIDAAGTSLEEIRARANEIRRNAEAEVARLTQDVERRAREFAGSVQESVRDALGTDPVNLAQRGERLFQQGSDTLRLIRAIGDPPKTDRLGFNRPEVAYVFNEVNKVVDMTPAVALVNRAVDSAVAAGAAAEAADKLLQSFGIRLPASALADQIVPDRLKNLDITKLFPDFSGLKLDGLFKNLSFPDLPESDAIKVRHGFDKTELRAWLEADIDVPFDRPAPLLEFGPIKIVVDGARFTSSARLSAGRDGTERKMRGQIAGDWRVVASGQTVLTFRRTGLYFDESGRLDFRIQPDRVELADALKFLTDFMKATTQRGGFQVVPHLRGGVPAGVAASLDLPIPPIQTGVFGISDLSLHVLFGIAAVPDFELFTELFLASKTAPFTLNIWILNGGGFLTSRLSFLPTARPAPLLTYSLEIGILAGVGLGFSFGVVSGGVWLQVGCSVQLVWRTGSGGSTTAVRVFILARGNVDVAGLITASVHLLLEVAYNGASLIGSGTLAIRVKVSMFFTLSVSERVEYVFAGKSDEQGAEYTDCYE